MLQSNYRRRVFASRRRAGVELRPGCGLAERIRADDSRGVPRCRAVRLKQIPALRDFCSTLTLVAAHRRTLRVVPQWLSPRLLSALPVVSS